MDRLLLSLAERAEIVVDMRPGEHVVLRSYPPDLGTNSLADRFNGGSDEFDIVQLRADDDLRPSPQIPNHLAPPPHIDLEGAQIRTFQMQGRTINGKAMDMARIDETVPVGTTQIWEVTNSDGSYHNFHIHDIQFQTLSVDGHRPPPQLSGWKDTFYMAPGRTVRLAMRFTDYTDPDSPYMYHCHLLQHEDSGMMGQFVVVRPGQASSSPPSHQHGR